MSFVSDATVLGYVKSLCQKATAETMEPFWDGIVSVANAAAYRFIVTYWASKGYLAAQIANWDFGADFQKQLAGFLAVNRMYQLYPSDYASSLAAAVDPRKDLTGDAQLGLEPQPLIVDGEFADPEGTRGSVSYGAYTTDNDLFVMDTEDPRLGQTTSL